MLVPSIFSDNFFDDFFEFPFIDDRAERNDRTEKNDRSDRYRNDSGRNDINENNTSNVKNHFRHN